MRKCRESISLHFLIFSPFPPHFLILSPFPLRFLFISSFSLHFLAARLQGCNDLCSPGVVLYTRRQLLGVLFVKKMFFIENINPITLQMPFSDMATYFITGRKTTSSFHIKVTRYELGAALKSYRVGT